MALRLVFAFQLAISNVFFQAVFSWVWFKTESLPLVGWFHQWFDTARDGTQQFVIGFGSSLWVTVLWAFPFYLVGTFALIQIAREEGASLWTLAPPPNEKSVKTAK